jgi:hypothetical protein
MSLNFSNTRLLGVSQASKFIGGDVFRLSTTQTISIEGMINPELPGGVSQVDSNFSLIQGEINDMKAAFLTGNGFTPISLNGVSIGNGKIISLDFPSSTDITENSITLGKYNATIEVYAVSSSVNGDFVPDTDTYDASTIEIIEAKAINIEDFSENFSFNVTEDDAFNYSQEITINLRKTTEEDEGFGVATAKAIVGAILGIAKSANAKLGYIDDRYASYLTIIDGTALFSENYNEVRNEYAFSRNLSLLPSYEGGKYYSAKITHAITMNDSGIFNIVESGEVKGMKGSAIGKYTNAKNGMENDLLPAAAGRCTSIFNKYKSGVLSDQSYSTFGNSGELSPQSSGTKAIRTSKRFNPIAGTVSYEIEFTNDPKILAGLVHDYTIEVTKDSGNITTATQRGTITPYSDKNIDFDYKDAFKSKTSVSDIIGEINALYGQVVSGKALAAYQLTNSTISYPRFGTSLTYSKTFSDDEAILDPATNKGLKRLDLKYNNGAPIRIKSTQMIPNIKENVYDADQISLGERGIAINAIIERDFGSTNQLPAAITTQKEKLRTALTRLINEATTNSLFKNSTHMPIDSYDIYPTSCTYSINSANQVSFNLESAYVFKDGRSVGDLESFFARSE